MSVACALVASHLVYGHKPCTPGLASSPSKPARSRRRIPQPILKIPAGRTSTRRASGIEEYAAKLACASRKQRDAPMAFLACNTFCQACWSRESRESLPSPRTRGTRRYSGGRGRCGEQRGASQHHKN
ncbi:hypothetical protein LZ32DRAFT_311632 [Colletotrichum eremochloae]|nr:hypothetical protein LZ32DRAFT_311632 [Colletotrichum eremochloae]